MNPETVVHAALPDPALASPVNLVFLVLLTIVGGYFAREMRLLRETVTRQAEELARTAKGSETRAETAAAEITRLAAEIGVIHGHVDETLTAIALVGRAVTDKLALLKIEVDLRDDGDFDAPPHGTRPTRPEGP